LSPLVNFVVSLIASSIVPSNFIAAAANKVIGVPSVGGVLMHHSCPFCQVAIPSPSQMTSDFVKRHRHITM
jgi:hypothetical protein